MENIRCIKCKIEKPTMSFHVLKTMRSGFSNICKNCKSEDSKKRRELLKLDPQWVEEQRNRSKINYYKNYRSESGLLRYKFNSMKRRCLEKDIQLPNFTFESFVKWSYENGFKDLYDKWVDNDYNTDLSPSVDRINPMVGYIFENMRLINWKDNNKYGNYIKKVSTVNKKIMSIKLNKLWGSSKFINMSVHSKYLYIYLTSHNTINTLGVLSLPLNLISYETGLTIDELRTSTKELIDENYIYVVNDNKDLYWIIPSHFSTVGNSDSTIEKIKSDMKSLPKKVVDFLEKIGISANKKKKKFDKPTPDEIQKYGFSMGYFVDGETFYNFYQNNPKSDDNFWYDSRGKLVLDWKAKLRKVWFKEDRKIRLPKDAPSGYEYFYVMEGEKAVFPTKWENGKPYGYDFTTTKKLQSAFKKQKE